LDHLLSKDTLEIRPILEYTWGEVPYFSSCQIRGDIGPVRTAFDRLTPAPHEGLFRELRVSDDRPCFVGRV
jgi:hypothetical protein